VSKLKAILWLLLHALWTGCSSSLPPPDAATPAYQIGKIKFSLDPIRHDGLRGPHDGLTSVAYEFCIPSEEAVYEEIRLIDPSVKFHKGSGGRIGCGDEETLCIGETHQIDWKEKLLTLSSIPYIHEIRECYFE
jgi:hypothetical protein